MVENGNYRGLWKPRPKPIENMDREEIVQHLRAFRDAWELITTRNQDLSDEYLSNEPLTRAPGNAGLRRRLQWYFSDRARCCAESWLYNSKQ